MSPDTRATASIPQFSPRQTTISSKASKQTQTDATQLAQTRANLLNCLK